jgi:transposase
MGERLKNLPKAVQEQLLDRSKYKELKISDEETDEEITMEYYTMEYKGRRIITTYSAKRAARDRKEREEKLERAKQFLSEPSKVEKKAASYFLKKDKKSRYEIDEKKIAKSQRYDGFLSIATNAKDLTEAEILDAYKQLYRIEHTFRTFKSYLEARPMFHWTERRIEGHLCLCYICFTLLNYLQQRLEREGFKMSEMKVRQTIDKLQLSLVKQDGEEFYMRSNTGEEARRVFKLLKIRELPSIISKGSLSEYIAI